MTPITLRLPDELHVRLKAEAKRDGRSVHSLILLALLQVAEDFEDVTDKSPMLRREVIPEGANVVVIPRLSVSPPFEAGAKKVELGPPKCTCGAGEKAKGKHNKWCPVKA